MNIDELVGRAKAGDDRAFFQLMQPHKQKLYRLAARYLGNEADALEAIQETTFRAFLRITSLKQPEFFATWITRILLNVCTDELRRRKRFVAMKQESPAPAPQLEGMWDMEQAVSRMEPKLKQIIVLKYYEGYTLTEIAELLQCPEGTVKSRLHKALKTLRKQLQGNGGWSHASR